MNSYLANLVMRTLEPQPAVQPRLAPMFGPPPIPELPLSMPEGNEYPATAAGDGDAPRAARLRAASNDPSTPDPGTRLAPRAESMPDVREVTELTKPTANAGRDRSKIDGRGRQSGIGERQPILDLYGEGETNEPAPEALTPVRAKNAERPIRRERHSPQAADARQAAAAEPKHISGSLSQARTDSTEQRPHLEEAARSALGDLQWDVQYIRAKASQRLEQDEDPPQTPAPKHPAVIATRIRFDEADTKPGVAHSGSLRPPVRNDVKAREPVTPPPTIEVTIGRVEVRTAIAAQPGRKAPATSSPSLAEYLRRRSGLSSP